MYIIVYHKSIKIYSIKYVKLPKFIVGSTSSLFLLSLIYSFIKDN